MTKFNVGDTVVIVEDAESTFGHQVYRGEVYWVCDVLLGAFIVTREGHDIIVFDDNAELIEGFSPHYGYILYTGPDYTAYVAHTFTQALRFCDGDVTFIRRVDNRKNGCSNSCGWAVENGEFDSGVIGWLPVNNYTKTEGEVDAY